jgi:large subunit ribosomal protein L13
MKTYSAKPKDITRKWYVIDAAEVPLGRMATRVASLLLGKEKPSFTHHIDVGDYVIVINTAHIRVTGYKLDTKMYYRHSGFSGGLTEATMREKMASDPSFIVLQAVRGMLPVNKLRPARLARLKLYLGSEHEHDPQQPETISLITVAKTVRPKDKE